jgi:enamine deaminase RidA (YjgF/YER057c/UK114 family)
MSQSIKSRIEALGLELPEPSKPGANYVPYLITGNLLFLTGQLCHWNGERKFIGKLGDQFDVEEGQEAAKICALNLVAQIDAALDGNFDRVQRIVKVAGYINSTPDFSGHSQVMDGASNLFVNLFEDAGRHSRLAVGVSGLPYNVAVEVEAIVEIDS